MAEGDKKAYGYLTGKKEPKLEEIEDFYDYSEYDYF